MSTIHQFYSSKIFAILFLEIGQLFQNYSLCFKVPTYYVFWNIHINSAHPITQKRLHT